MRPRIELGEPAPALQLPNGPYYEETGGAWVMVVSPDGSTATRRIVTLGRRNPEAVEIVSGLRAGERVITSSYQDFKTIERVDLSGPIRRQD
jgi:HlyD family secretion protein